MREFELAIEGLRFFYENGLSLPESEHNKSVIAIHLLFLLSTHRNEEFYTKLENLTTAEIHYDLVQYVLKMNEAIEEGNYRKVFEKRKQSPLDHFSPFLEKIEDTIRIEVAKSAEKAYSELTLEEALKVFQTPTEAALREFIASYAERVGEPTVSWRLENNRVYFDKVGAQTVKFNSEELIKTMLLYSEEL
jgi:26S proteasome regulatory subunit N12